MQYAETSAKEAQDVEEPFKLIAAAIKRAFEPQAILYGPTSKHWNISSWMDSDPYQRPRVHDRNEELAVAMAEVLEQCDACFTEWYLALHGEGAIERLQREVGDAVARRAEDARTASRREAVLDHVFIKRGEGVVDDATVEDDPQRGPAARPARVGLVVAQARQHAPRLERRLQPRRRGHRLLL